MLNDPAERSTICSSVPHDQADLLVHNLGELDELAGILTLIE
jgi:hypothetical protein